MKTRSKWNSAQTVVLDKYNEFAAALVDNLDKMREHRKKCVRCRNLPLDPKETRPCHVMTFYGVEVASLWAEVPRTPPATQLEMFNLPSNPEG